MSQSSVPWTNAATDPYLPSIEQDTYSQAQLDAIFAQDANDQTVFTPVFQDDLDDFKFTPDNGSHSHGNSSNPSTASTPDFSSYSFGQQLPYHPYTEPGTPQPYPLSRQLHHTFEHPNLQNRPLPLRTQTSSSFVLPSQPPQGYDRRRSLSHGDVDRIAAPPHPTLVRLQNLQGAKARSATPKEHRRSGYPSRGRSVSQGPTIVGRPLKNTVPYFLPGSPLVGLHPAIGTPIGTPFERPHDARGGSRKRTRPFYSDHDPQYQVPDPYLCRMTDPTQLRHSRRIIEIGAMAVRNHTKIDPKLETDDSLSPHERIVKKLEDVERHLKQDEADNQDALKGCAMIREALNRRVQRERVVVKLDDDDAATRSDELDAPSLMMSKEDSGIVGGGLDDDDLMGLLIKENERLGDVPDE
jgi:hypothetical protein